MATMTIGEILLIHIRRKYGTQQVACEKLGISKSLMSAALKGTRAPPATLLMDAGYVARVVYEPINQPTESESK